MSRAMLFRWYKRKQLDIRLWSGYLSLGLDWRDGLRAIAYWSPDATPVHPAARGLGAGRG